MIRDAVRDDQGFSLPELLVVVGLLGAVLAVAWAGIFGIRTGDRIARAEGEAAVALSDPMEQMSKIIMQNTSVRSTNSYRIEVWTDRDMNGQPELNAIYATADGRLIWEWWLYNTARTAIQQHRVWVMSENCANVTEGRPLFSYVNKSGQVLTGNDIIQKGPSDSVSVRASVIVDMGDGQTRDDIRLIQYRTRS